ncbi:MAG TPA: ABC transporter transmembrane domain-containing protein [Gemmatimonadaceae bacterium]|nr:ABC transporter transmembrane domain-containing protein [Gemmatimonadaceae bacterium]
MRLYRRLLSFLRPHWWRMAGTIASSVIAAGLDAFSFTLLIPFLNALFKVKQYIPANGKLAALQQRLLGAFLDPANPLRSLEAMILAIVIIVIIKNVFVWSGGQLGAALQELVTRDLRDRVFRHLQRLPLGYFQRTKTGQVISKVLSDTEQTKALITDLVTKSIQNVAQIVATVVVLLYISPRLTLVSLVIAPILTLALQPILRRLRHAYRRLRNDYGEITSVLQEVVSGIRLVKSFGAEGYEDARFTDANNRYSGGMVRVARTAVLSQPLTEVIGTAVAVLILWMGAREVLAPGATLDGATLITFMIMVMRLLPPLKQLSQTPTTAQQSMAAAERLFDVLDQPTEAEMDKGTVRVEQFRDRVEFDELSFAYDHEPVLTDISFVARRGEVVALVGASGAGKSTLVDLIPRLYEPTAGRIVLDGTDTRRITLDSLRALTGIVSQDTVLFNDTVRRNIAYGAGDRYTDAQIEAAARAANAHGFITELPEGYGTVLGERGTRLSGGQRQRLAIARALLTDPPILILDEATSALDTESERLVQEAIDRLLAGRTVFVIAHRLSTITHASQILVLDRGRIVERGTHAELLALAGAYHRLHALQFRDERAPAAPAADADTPPGA